MATTADAVVDQRLETLETMCTNLARRVEVMKAVMELLALEAGKDWRALCERAQRRLERRKAKEAAVGDA